MTEYLFEFIKCPDCGARAVIYRNAPSRGTITAVAHAGKSALMERGATDQDCLAWLHAIHRLSVVQPGNFTASVINRH